MKYGILLLLSSVVFFSCSWPESSVTYYFDEKEGEVLLTDLNGVEYSLVCGVNGKEKKCGVVFSGFSRQSSHMESYMEYSTSTVVIPGFKDASILSIQMKNESTGKSKTLVSYFQDDVPYMKGSAFVPSVMNLNVAEPSSEYKYTGYYDDGKWVNRDTTISIGDTLFANEKGVLDFSIVDAKGNKAHLVVDLAKLLEDNDAGSIDTMRVSSPESESYVFHYWTADSGTISIEALETNFEFDPPNVLNGCNESDPKQIPFIHFVLKPSGDRCTYDTYIANGGANEKMTKIEVVNYAK